MKKFWGYASNGNVSVGCTGQVVHVFDGSGNEIGKFKDITYGYTPVISPDGTLLVVKSTEGRLAVYSLETLTLIKKFRFSKVNNSQDDGCCFSPDGRFFINIERHEDGLHSAISFYNTDDFSLAERVMVSEKMMVDHIEFDKIADSCYVLGFMRDENGIMTDGFVSLFENFQIKDIRTVPEDEYRFYCSYKSLELSGFTEKKYEWSYIDRDLSELKMANYTLAELHERSKY